MVVRPRCKCGNLCKTNGKSSVDGRRLYKKYCNSCSKVRYGGKGALNRSIKKDSCEWCGFNPEHSCQLDLDHIDGLKTYQNKDWLPSKAS